MKSATKPSKQRKMLFQAPYHIRRRYLASRLSAELRASQGVKSLPVRSGDTVRIMRGDFKGFEGKVTRIDRKNYRMYVEGLTREKADGTTIFVPIHPSKVMIARLDLDDKWRRKILERKRMAREQREEVEEKPKTEETARAKEAGEERTSKRTRKRTKTRKKTEKKTEKSERPKKTKKTSEKKTRGKRMRKDEGSREVKGGE